MTNDAEEPVSNNARALTTPCGVSTMTWPVISNMLELMDTCIIFDSLLATVVTGAFGLAAASFS